MKGWPFFLMLLFLAGCRSEERKTVFYLERPDRSSVSIDLADGSKGHVFFFLLPDCPLARFYTMSLNQVQSIYKFKGYRFYGIVPGDLYSKQEIDSFKVEHQFVPDILVDPDKKLASHFSVQIVPQVILTDKKGEIIYSGKVDDQAIEAGRKRYKATRFYLLEALQAHMQGKKPRVQQTKPAGCYVE